MSVEPEQIQEALEEAETFPETYTLAGIEYRMQEPEAYRASLVVDALQDSFEVVLDVWEGISETNALRDVILLPEEAEEPHWKKILDEFKVPEKARQDLIPLNAYVTPLRSWGHAARNAFTKAPKVAFTLATILTITNEELDEAMELMSEDALFARRERQIKVGTKENGWKGARIGEIKDFILAAFPIWEAELRSQLLDDPKARALGVKFGLLEGEKESPETEESAEPESGETSPSSTTT